MRNGFVQRIGLVVTPSVFTVVFVFFFAANMAAGEISIVPKPVAMTAGTGTFTLTANTPILVETGKADVADTGNYLAGIVAAGTGMKLAVKDSDSATAVPGSILLTTKNADASLGDEGYSLEATDQGVTIRAPKSAGLFYGVQSLLQLLPPGIYSQTPVSGVQWTVPAVKITDQPRFKWRGIMLDIARHFEPKDQILRYMDMLAFHKMNVLHLHLDDDQGWRIEIKKYPKLTSVGASRAEPGFNLDASLSFKYTFGPDGRYGGFLSQDDCREIVAYGQKLHITILPEIEMPGHSVAAVSAYPEYSVSGAPVGGSTAQSGISSTGVFCAGNPDTYKFISDILNEVMNIFPSQYIHVGGDEVPARSWSDAKDQQLIADQHLTGVDQIEPYFMNQIAKIVQARGRTMIGWDEIFTPNEQQIKPPITLDPKVAVMLWHGVSIGAQAAAQGYDVVMSPTSNCYLDYKQGGNETEAPFGAAGNLPLERVYSFDPVANMNAAQMSHIMGVQGNLWSEHVPNISQAEYMTWPRGAALAEIGWSPAGKNYDDFINRMKTDEYRLDAAGFDYRPVETEMLPHIVHLDASDLSKMVIDAGVPNATIYYTLNHTFPTVTMDQALPTPDAKKYTGPMDFIKGWADIKVGVVRAGSKATIIQPASLLDGRMVTFTSTLVRDNTGGNAHPNDLFWTSGAPTAADNVLIVFDTPQVLHSASIHTGGGTGYSGTELQHGVLEVSADGKTFTQAAEFQNGAVETDLGGKTIAAVRIRVTQAQPTRVIFKDITLK